MELAKYDNYQQYKQELDTELRRTMEGFVKIGYLLKVAKDTDILRESGYRNVYEFAQAEYGIDKSQVSRFMNINDRFSEGGYSDRLKEQFRGFGYAKLSIMLLLPDEVNEELSPEFTKSEIQAIKEEYDEENKISDLEILMEIEKQEQKDIESNLYKVLHQLGKEDPELYVKLFDAVYENVDAVQETLAPDKEKIYSIRIMGIARMVMSVKGVEKPISITNLRSNEKEYYDWDNLMDILNLLTVAGVGPEESWEKTYGEKFPKKSEVAPVQPTTEKKKEPPKKESKVQKAKKPEPKKSEPKKEEPQSEEQIPGQDNIMNHPEYLPEDMKKEAENQNNSSSTEETEVENVTENSEIVTVVPEEAVNEQEVSELEQPAAGVEEASKPKEEDNIRDYLHELNTLFCDWELDKVPMEELQKAYDNAINLVAALERMMINHGKI